MTGPAIASMIAYSALRFVGGLMGYSRAQSKASLIAGCASGTAMLIFWVIAASQPRTGLSLAGLLAVALTILFASRFRKTNAFMPSGMMGLISAGATLWFLTSAWNA